jgi:hypothetical protein
MLTQTRLLARCGSHFSHFAGALPGCRCGRYRLGCTLARDCWSSQAVVWVPWASRNPNISIAVRRSRSCLLLDLSNFGIANLSWEAGVLKFRSRDVSNKGTSRAIREHVPYWERYGHNHQCRTTWEYLHIGCEERHIRKPAGAIFGI